MEPRVNLVKSMDQFLVRISMETGGMSFNFKFSRLPWRLNTRKCSWLLLRSRPVTMVFSRSAIFIRSLRRVCSREISMKSVGPVWVRRIPLARGVVKRRVTWWDSWGVGGDGNGRVRGVEPSRVRGVDSAEIYKEILLFPW